jgi:HD-like signal output (HDOD) protein
MSFSRLELLFKRAGSLPALPNTLICIVKTLDRGEHSAAELERLIVADPGLSAEFMRIAAVSAQSTGGTQFTTIRGAIMLLGEDAVRSLATSLMMRQFMNKTDSIVLFDKLRYARHCLAVALIAQYLFVRKQQMGRMESKWTPDEVFAAGLLSGLALGLLTKVAPDIYMRIFAYARRGEYTLDRAFEDIYGNPMSPLAAVAAEAWQLPSLFRTTFAFSHAPWECMEEYSALCCLNHAKHLSASFGLGTVDWDVSEPPKPDVEAEVGLASGEQEMLKDAIRARVDSYMDALDSLAA